MAPLAEALLTAYSHPRCDPLILHYHAAIINHASKMDQI